MWLITICLILALVALIYIFLTWNYSHWKKLGVNGPKPQAFFGNFPNSKKQKHHIVDDIDQIYRQFRKDNDFVGVFNMRTPQLLILSPELCNRVFVSDFKHFHDNDISAMIDEKSDFLFATNIFSLTGENWKERRALLAPGLTIGRIKATYPVTNIVCRKMTEYIKQQLKMSPKEPIESRDLSLRFTLEMVTDSVLGVKARSFEVNSTPNLDMINKLSDSSYFAIVGLLPAFHIMYAVVIQLFCHCIRS